MAHERLHPALVVQQDVDRLGMAQVAQLDHHARVQERQLAQAVLQRLQVEVDVAEGGDRRKERHLRAGQRLAGVLADRGLARDLQRLDRVAALEAHLVALAVAVDLQLQPIAERVHHRHAHAVQAARDLVGILVELTARVQLGHDDLGGRDALALVDVGRDAASVVGHRDRAVGVQDHLHQVGVPRQRLVDGVVHHLIDHVVQTRAVVGVADIHAGALAHRIQALENLDGIGAVFGLFDGLVGHRVSSSEVPQGTGRRAYGRRSSRDRRQTGFRDATYKKLWAKSETFRRFSRASARRPAHRRTGPVHPARRTARVRCRS